MRDKKLAATVPAYVLAHKGAKAPAGTMIATKLDGIAWYCPPLAKLI